ncbi:restriction endonuclease subunit S [Phocaeicola plebeius]|jgi:type I restriction enzyme S subunit|uniref:restriction endonuclease subunit S n=1 Tax=Phocaeicola plebeius TaxID=310297 RepID=UPI0022E1C24E|nr:restriction endonuclease subunit S [Phocaeicola plebeius]
MSKENYRRLGDYIREVDVRNRDLEVKLSQGISNEKYFQQPKQVAINPYNDKIVRKGQFAFNRATTRNGNKISIAYREEEDCTVSASYCVFDVKNEDILSPKYLMMWFRRPEFDRYAIYHSHGSAHEYFTFENMCDVELPIPSIEQQRKIVAEYETISRRIRLNEQMITRLEETAQTLYRKMFVDGIDKENLSEGWRIRTLGDVAHILDYKRKPLSAEQRALIKGKYPYFGAMSIIDYIDDSLLSRKSG